jgi:ferritin-like metal-binding protein YciE
MAKQPKTLDALFHDTLKDIYFAEKKAAQHPQLKVAFEHLKETEGHVQRLERSS